MMLNAKNLPNGYLEHKKPEFEALDWLIGYYEKKTVIDPKKYLEVLLDSSKQQLAINEDSVRFAIVLYYWVYYKRISND